MVKMTMMMLLLLVWTDYYFGAPCDSLPTGPWDRVPRHFLFLVSILLCNVVMLIASCFIQGVLYIDAYWAFSMAWG